MSAQTQPASTPQVDPLADVAVQQDGTKPATRRAEEMRDQAVAEANEILSSGAADVPQENPFTMLDERGLRGECVKRNILAANVMSVEDMQAVLFAHEIKRKRTLIVKRAPQPETAAPPERRVVTIPGLPPSADGLYRAKNKKAVSVPGGGMTMIHEGSTFDIRGYGEKGLRSLAEQGIQFEAVTPPPAAPPAAEPKGKTKS